MKDVNPIPNDAGGEDRLARFERLLRQDVGVPSFDWAALEGRLFARIHAADQQGDLAQLKADAPADAALFERIEGRLMARIAAYKEYEQPIDAVIASPAPALEGQWLRMEHHIDERVSSLHGIADWELTVKASIQPAPAVYEAIEEGLEHVLQTAPEETWERLLKADEPTLTQGKLETVEQNLFTRIAAQGKQAELIPTGFAFTFAWLTRSAMTRAASLTLLVALVTSLAWWGYGTVNESLAPLATVIYETQGQSTLDGAANGQDMHVGATLAVESAPTIASGSGRAVTVVNGRGFVELRNGATVRIEKANHREVRYRYVPQSGKWASGKATFFVTKRKAKENFIVNTPDYRIEVLGTYFQVHPDVTGKVATTVLEGKVHIASPDFGDLYLTQGQSLVFDESSGKYRVQDGGPVVTREAIESIPEMRDLNQYQVLAITTDEPQAEITIDGRYRGVAPLAILQSPGPHQIRVSKSGFVTLDTLVTVKPGANTHLALDMSPVPFAPKVAEVIPPALPSRAMVSRKPALSPVLTPAIEASKPRSEGPLSKGLNGEELFHAAEAAQSQDWALAIKLYEEVLAQEGPGIRREAALFSIARLRADHSNTEEGRREAKQDFLDYLARYPEGTFNGESWLRLAELELDGNPDKAIEYYLKVFERYPRHHRLAELQHRVGLIYLQQKRYDQAVAMFRQGLSNVLLENDTAKRKLLQGLQRALAAKGDITSAERVGQDLQKLK